MLAIGAALAVVGGGALTFGGAVLLLSHRNPPEHPAPASSSASMAGEPVPLSTPPAIVLPAAERAFVSTIQSYVARYSGAPNELVKTSLRAERRAALSRLLPDLQAKDWRGTIKSLSTFSDGKATVAITLDGSSVTLHTDVGNPFSPGTDTTIERGSVLYASLALLSVGERVRFKGSFLASEQDHLKETSFMEAGAMTEPEFVLRFTEVTNVLTAGTTMPNASSTPLVAQVEQAISQAILPPRAATTPLPGAETTSEPTPTPSNAGTSTPSMVSPRRVVADFYAWYLAQAKHGVAPWTEGSLTSRADIAEDLERTLQRERDPDSKDDPLLAMQAVPRDYTVVEDKMEGNDATVTVRLEAEHTSQRISVSLTRQDDGHPWQIDNVQPTGAVAVVTAATPMPVHTPTPTDNLPQSLQMAEVRLNGVYAQLRGRLDARHKAALKQEELQWIKRKEALAGDDPRRLALIEGRIEKLTHWGETTTATNDSNRGFMDQGVVPAPTIPPLLTTAIGTAPGTAFPIPSSWTWSFYQNHQLPCQLPLPSYWHLLRQPTDENATASWIGPAGIILSAYAYDKAAEGDFWDRLKQSAHVHQVTTGPPAVSGGQGEVVLQQYETMADGKDGVSLQFVMTVQFDQRSTQKLALSVRTPLPMTKPLGWAMGYDTGFMVGTVERARRGQQVDLSKRCTLDTDPLMMALAKAAHPPDTAQVPAGSTATLLTKAQWKEKMGRNFRWYPGTPVMGQAGQFERIMGKPDRTQTVGDQAYWYYQCSDGTIQLVMNVLNLQAAGFVQADVNDF